MASKQPAVYIMASEERGTLYIGVTGNLKRRAWEHREGLADGFTKRYGLKRLVWHELHPDFMTAIARETQIKRWNGRGSSNWWKPPIRRGVICGGNCWTKSKSRWIPAFAGMTPREVEAYGGKLGLREAVIPAKRESISLLATKRQTEHRWKRSR